MLAQTMIFKTNSGDMTFDSLDVAGDIILDADGANISFRWWY